MGTLSAGSAATNIQPSVSAVSAYAPSGPRLEWYCESEVALMNHHRPIVCRVEILRHGARDQRVHDRRQVAASCQLPKFTGQLDLELAQAAVRKARRSERRGCDK